jgi:hypothetical protein
VPPLVPPQVGAYFGNVLLLGCDPTHPNKMLCSFAIVVNTHGISDCMGFCVSSCQKIIIIIILLLLLF